MGYVLNFRMCDSAGSITDTNDDVQFLGDGPSRGEIMAAGPCRVVRSNMRRICQLFSNSFLLYSKEMVDIVHSLYKDMRSPADPALRPIIILSIFARTTPALDAHIPFDCTMTERIRILDARNAAINKITEQLDDLGLFPLTKLDLMSVLESRITRTARPVLAYILKNQHTLEITDTDVHAIAENTAVAALTCSSKVCKLLFLWLVAPKSLNVLEGIHA